MKCFFLAFFLIIIAGSAFGWTVPPNVSNSTYTQSFTVLPPGTDANSFCSNQGFGGCVAAGLHPWRTYVELSNGITNYHYFASFDACPTGQEYFLDISLTSNNYNCVVSQVIDPLCSATNTASDCLCSDGQPKVSGQWTTCDRPALTFCEFLGRATLPKDCPTFDLPDYECPTDANWENGQCVNKCGINAHYNAVTNKCADNEGNDTPNNSCPSGYSKNIDGFCVPNKCPANKKLVNNVCVIDTDPKVETKTTTVTNNDNSTTTTTITTTTINNSNGTTSTSTNTTVTNKNPAGETTNVDSKTKDSEDKTEEPEEEKSDVSGGATCSVPPACSGDAIQCALLNQQWKTACLESDDAVSEVSNCSAQFSCEGSVFECAALKFKHDKFCSLTASVVNDFTNSAEFKQHFDASTDVGADGILKSLTPSQINISSNISLASISGITGRAGSCPSDMSHDVFGSSVPFSYGAICTTATESRPIFLFFVLLFCMNLVRKQVIKG